MITPRKRDAEGNFLPDPPLGPPYQGYSMMEMVKREHAELTSRGGFGYQVPKPQPPHQPTPVKKKRRR